VVSEPGLAIWLNSALHPQAPDLTVKIESEFGSAFFRGTSKEQPTYLKAYSQVSQGPRLTPNAVATLVKGGSVAAEFIGRAPESKPYRAFLALSDVQIIPWKSQPERSDRILRFGRAFAMERIENGKPAQWGWEVDQIVFPRRIKHGNDYVEFEPAHAFQCLKTGECTIHAYQIVYVGAVKRSADYRPTAKLQVSLLREPTHSRSAST